jgi:DNA-3-methyladenine glycosylase II
MLFLICSLNRSYVLPTSDLGVRTALRDSHGLDELRAPKECQALARPWRPFRTIACWYLWTNADKSHDQARAGDAPEDYHLPGVWS